MKKIIAVILIVSFLAVTPAQADGPDRSAYAADQNRSEKADRQDRSEKADRQDRENRTEEADREDRTEEAAIPVLMIASARSDGGGIWCCLA